MKSLIGLFVEHPLWMYVCGVLPALLLVAIGVLVVAFIATVVVDETLGNQDSVGAEAAPDRTIDES